MPNDAKLGLVAGVGLVIAIAVVFYRKDPAIALPQADASQTAALAAVPAREQNQPWAKTSYQGKRGERPVRQHVVVEGETLQSLALRYYGDSAQSFRIFETNRSVIARPERLNAGTVLFIPDGSN